MPQHIIPIPQANVSVREATLDDVAFIDALQKLHSDRVGFMRDTWIAEKIRKNEVIVAEEAGAVFPPSGAGVSPASPGADQDAGGTPAPRRGEPLGYCMGVDRYKYRDDVGIIYQLNVVPGRQRGFVGMTLLRAMFDRAAYGCRLFSAWCAQDIEANHFWEAMGFVPLAYRGGSERKKRVHIFWQKRIREGDTPPNATPWWFPSQTSAGAIGEDRLVFPIPPGRHWSDEMPVILPPDVARASRPRLMGKRNAGGTPAPRGGNGPTNLAAVGGIRFAPAEPIQPACPEQSRGACPERSRGEKPKREKKPKRKNDPKLVAAARELRDRWLEHVNSGEMLIEGAGKYDVVRQRHISATAVPLLPAA